MATFYGNGSGTTGGSSYTLKLDVWENSVDTTNNKSNVGWALKLDSGTYNFADWGIPTYVYVDGEVYNASPKLSIGKYSEITIASGSKDIWHNSDGSKTISCTGKINNTGAYYLPGVAECNGTLTLTKIARYATSNQSLASRTATSIKMNWSSDSTVDYVWYSTNGGSSWNAVGSVNASSGSYTITGLSQGTTYSIRTRVRRKDSQLTTDSSTLSVTTYSYATSNQSLASRTTNSIKMNWSSNATIDYIWYSVNNGSSWTAVGSVNATSGSYTISGLSADTTYNIKTRVRRKDNQLTTDSSSLSVTTYGYATSNQSLNSKTINTITMNWSSNKTVDYIWYSVNGGSSWTGLDVNDGTSGNYTVSGLSANTTYNIKTRVRRKDSQLTTDSGSLSITTYDIAKISECGNLNIGDNLVVKYSNPANATINIGIYKTDGITAIIAYRSCSSTSYTFSFSQSELDNLYKLCGSSNSFEARVYIQTTQNSKTYTNYKEITINLTGNVLSIKININGVIKRGKVWIGTSSGNKRGIATIGTSNGNKRGI